MTGYDYSYASPEQQAEAHEHWKELVLEGQPHFKFYKWESFPSVGYTGGIYNAWIKTERGRIIVYYWLGLTPRLSYFGQYGAKLGRRLVEVWDDPLFSTERWDNLRALPRINVMLKEAISGYLEEEVV